MVRSLLQNGAEPLSICWVMAVANAADTRFQIVVAEDRGDAMHALIDPSLQTTNIVNIPSIYRHRVPVDSVV